MKTIESVYNIPWIPQPNEVHIHLTAELPPLDQITTAFAFAFSGDRLLLTNIQGRGWSPPGGHREPGETPEQAACREAAEEAGARLKSLRLFAVQQIRILAPRPEGYRYPYPDSYQVFYLAEVDSLLPFQPYNENLGRRLFSPGEARDLPWVGRNRALYEAALAATRTGPAFSLRPLTEADIPRLVALYRQCADFIALGTAAPPDEAMVRADMALSAREGGTFEGIFLPDGTLAGVVDCAYGGYEGTPNLAFLILLMIGAPWRRLGLGRAVVQQVEERVWQRSGVDTFRTAVQVNNPDAIAFWEAVGFRRIGGAELQPDGTTTYLLEKGRPPV